MTQFSANKFCLLAYLLIAIPTLIVLSHLIPQFHTPDEPYHYIRAYQVYKGNTFPQKHNPPKSRVWVVGGRVDIGIKKYSDIITSIAYDSKKKITPELKRKSEQIHWISEHWHTTPNVAIYPPAFYYPAALGIYIGKKNKLNIADSILVSRALNIVAGLLIASIAILLSGNYAFYTTTILLFPMVLSQMASTSQDGLMLPTAALFAALLVRLAKTASLSKSFVYAGIASLLLILLATSRPPYAALGLLIYFVCFLDTHFKKRRVAFFSMLFGIGVSLLWAYYVAQYVSIPFGDKPVNYSAQLSFIVQNPVDFITIFTSNIVQQVERWLEEMIGVLGWLDTRLPGDYYNCALIVTLLIILTYVLEKPKILFSKENLKARSLILSTLLISFFGIICVLYIVWNSVGSQELLGVQGRYFLPLLFASVTLFTKKETVALSNKIIWTRLFLLVLFGVSSAAITMLTVFERYYI